LAREDPLRLLAKGLEDVERYVKYLNEQGLRDAERFSMATLSDVNIEVELVGVLNLVSGYEGFLDMIERLVGEYDERKAEIEDEVISILREKLQQKFFVQDLHKRGSPFDLILVEREEKEPKEHRIVEVKSWKNIDFAIYTDNEKKFGEEFEEIGGNYWLYVVDMQKTPIRILGFRKPFTTNALRLFWEINKNGKNTISTGLLESPMKCSEHIWAHIIVRALQISRTDSNTGAKDWEKPFLGAVLQQNKWTDGAQVFFFSNLNTPYSCML